MPHACPVSDPDAPQIGVRFRQLLRVRRPRLLVVEDDADLRRMIERIGQGLDSELAIDWASGVSSARALLARESYELVLADYLLEGRESGLRLRPYCLRFQPEARFAMMSVLPLAESLERAGQPQIPFLRKPFSPAQLRAFLQASIPAGG